MLVICVLIAFLIAIFWLPLGQFYTIFGSALMVEGFILLIFGGCMATGRGHKDHPTRFRGHKAALEGEKEASKRYGPGYYRFGVYLAIAGILVLITGWIAYFL